MITEFKDIVTAAIAREGGFVNHPDDRGGATNYGVTISVLKRHGIDVDGDGDIDADDVKALPLKKAFDIYLQDYWKPGKCNRVPANLREFYFDMCINHGVRNAVWILQGAAIADGQQILHDGVIGPQTLNAVKYLDLERLVAQRVLFYANIVLEDPSQKTFWLGWFNRATEFLT